ncbi:MAG: hypothetical protein HY298_08105 [Verrucomicrobia bacterium]|nr:hypothetical protein [Verrucomicrobiota bacterium]
MKERGATDTHTTTLYEEIRKNGGDGSWIDYFEQRKNKGSSSLHSYFWWIVLSVVFIIVVGVLVSLAVKH